MAEPMTLNEVQSLKRGQKLAWVGIMVKENVKSFGETVEFLEAAEGVDTSHMPLIMVQTIEGPRKLSSGWFRKQENCTEELVHYPITTIEEDPETGIEFERTKCSKCGRWLGDKLI